MKKVFSIMLACAIIAAMSVCAFADEAETAADVGSDTAVSETVSDDVSESEGDDVSEPADDDVSEPAADNEPKGNTSKPENDRHAGIEERAQERAESAAKREEDKESKKAAIEERRAEKEERSEMRAAAKEMRSELSSMRAENKALRESYSGKIGSAELTEEQAEQLKELMNELKDVRTSQQFDKDEYMTLISEAKESVKNKDYDTAKEAYDAIYDILSMKNNKNSDINSLLKKISDILG